VEPLARSYLYAPGHRPEIVAKALAGEADVVVVDLEDSVPADRKAAARESAVAALRALAPPERARLHVRVNPVRSDVGRDDLRALAQAGPTTVRLPKVTGADDVLAVAGLAGSELRLSCLLESAAGVEHAYEIATAHPSVAAVGLGEADLRADLGVRAEAADAGLAYARSRVVVASRAAGLAPPVQSVDPQLSDLDALERSTRAGRDIGFFGRSAIHPSQVRVINAASLPSAAELDDARALLDALADDAQGVLPDGRYVDAAVVEGARRLLAWAGARRP
jgi:citrate lyase subunit beta/citryl-CoA lyase